MKNLIIALLFALPLSAQSKLIVIPDVGNLYAYAANNRLMGAFTPMATSNDSIGGVIRMEVLEEGVVYLRVARLASGLHWDTPQLRFESTDCSGTGYGSIYAKTIGDRLAFVGPGGRLLLATPDAVPVFKMFRSRALLGESGITCQEEATGTSGIPLREVAKLDDDFPPPFSLDPRSDRVRASTRH